jgi:hypothetical protein
MCCIHHITTFEERMSLLRQAVAIVRERYREEYNKNYPTLTKLIKEDI